MSVVWHRVSNLDEPKPQSLDEPKFAIEYNKSEIKYKKYVV